jgi:hypothetical protein
MHSGQAEQSSMVFGLLRSPFRVVLSALNQKRLVVVEGTRSMTPQNSSVGGFAFWDCGVSCVGIHFATDGRELGDPSGRRSTGTGLPGGGSGRLRHRRLLSSVRAAAYRMASAAESKAIQWPEAPLHTTAGGFPLPPAGSFRHEQKEIHHGVAKKTVHHITHPVGRSLQDDSPEIFAIGTTDEPLRH